VKIRSVGARLTLWYAAAFATALLLIGAAMWFAMQQSLYHAIDESLRARVAGIHIFIRDHKNRLHLDEVKEEFYAHGDLFQVLDDSGEWIHRDEALGSETIMGIAAATESGRYANITAAGEPLRFLSESLEIDGRRYAVQVAAPLRDLQQGLHDALWVLIPVFPLALLLASAGGYWVSRRALEPVDRITRSARAITAANLSQRIEMPPTDDELARLTETLNDMIGRLEAAFRKISQFTADASHELRTPLAVMRTTAEVALRTRAGAEHREALEHIVAEVGRTSHLVDNLLSIAKTDSGHEQLSRAPVDVVEIAREAATEIAVIARVKGVDLETQWPKMQAWVEGDRHALRRLFLILLDNAVNYTPAGGRVDLAIDTSDGHVRISICDTGIGIPAEDLPRIFDRFYRVDRARSRRQGGAGLGLAIGRWLAEQHRGAITVESKLGAGSRFEVRLPSDHPDRATRLAGLHGPE
jgi:heavy metal sensor kinase